MPSSKSAILVGIPSDLAPASEVDTARSKTEPSTESSRPPASTWIRRKRPDPGLRPDNTPTDKRHSSLRPDSVAIRIVETLVARGIDTFFGIPGGPICPLFEALRICSGAQLIESRHESHAAFSAAAYYRTTGRPAAVLVTAGPGVTNAITGVASASSENVPMLVIAGDVAWATHGGCLAQNSGPEGLNVDAMLAPVTRAQVRITNGRSAVSQTLSALASALDPLSSGPALLVVPINIATETSPRIEISPARPATTLGPSPEAVRFTARALAGAERPLLVLGGGCLQHSTWVRQLVDALDVPFVTTPRAKGVVSEEHPRSLRTGGMAASVWARKYTSQGVDVALVLGTDLDDTSVGPTPYVAPGKTLIHVDINPRVFNRNLPTELGVVSDIGHFCNDLYQLAIDEGLQNGRGHRLIKEARLESAYEVPDFQTDVDFRIPPHRAIADLQAAFGDARFATDIGEHMLFALHYLTARGPQDFHIQLNLGSMGSGIAGAIGLALADRDRPVVCICGDGGMQMSGMEILTSLKLRLPVIYAVFNDSRYNMVHHGMKQIFGVADRYDTPAIDFSVWARSMGIVGYAIRQSGQIDARLADELLRAGGPALLDIHIEPETRLRGGGRVEALQHMSILARSAEGRV